jgi:hypothetical protein
MVVRTAVVVIMVPADVVVVVVLPAHIVIVMATEVMVAGGVRHHRRWLDLIGFGSQPFELVGRDLDDPEQAFAQTRWLILRHPAPRPRPRSDRPSSSVWLAGST